jgi:hypothetical protein
LVECELFNGRYLIQIALALSAQLDHLLLLLGIKLGQQVFKLEQLKKIHIFMVEIFMTKNLAQLKAWESHAELRI